MRIALYAALLAVLSIVSPAHAQTPSGPPAVANDAQTRLHTDWAWLGRYQTANAALLATPGAPRIVFMGDSITQGWLDKMPQFFAAGRIGRGISGQTTPQMLLRFRQDVVELQPAIVQIMAGTNDIAGNTGPMTLEQTEGMIMSMAELAHAHGIRVILASIPPADHFASRPGLETAPKIAAINDWLRSYAAQTGAVYADYWSVLHDGQALKASLTLDGVHPNEAGYAVMAPVAEAAICRSLAPPAAGSAGSAERPGQHACATGDPGPPPATLSK